MSIILVVDKTILLKSFLPVEVSLDFHFLYWQPSYYYQMLDDRKPNRCIFPNTITGNQKS